jgi:hypothetical protein
MLVFVVGLLVLFNTGQLVNKKVEFNNVADAAAYSAAVQQARAYNAIAYLNRAQVANEVATAQLVSLHSWMNFAISSSDHFAKAVAGIGLGLSLLGAPEVGVPLDELGAQLMELKTTLVEVRNGMKVVLSGPVGAIAWLSNANLIFAGATRAVANAEILDVPALVNTIIRQNAVTAPGSTDKAASLSATSVILLGKQVVAANKSDIKLYQVPNKPGSPSNNPRHTADADRYANVVMAARDGFSARRDGDLLLLHKRGGTDLVSYNRWVAMDTLNAKYDCCWFVHINVPFAWGGAAGVSAPAPFPSLVRGDNGWNSPYVNDRGHHDPFGGALANGKAGSLARVQPATPTSDAAILTGYRGLQNYEDVAAGTAVVPYATNGTPDATEGPVFSVLIEQAMTDVKTTSNLRMGAPPGSPQVLQVALQAPDAAQNNKMTALASAQVYFDRPQKLFARADKERELGSLFSPYWQARLVDTPTSVKLELFGADAFGL